MPEAFHNLLEKVQLLTKSAEDLKLVLAAAASPLTPDDFGDVTDNCTSVVGSVQQLNLPQVISYAFK